MTVTTMAREIAEQPEALARTLEALRPLRPALHHLSAERRSVLFVARGSSDNAAVYDRLYQNYQALGAYVEGDRS